MLNILHHSFQHVTFWIFVLVSFTICNIVVYRIPIFKSLRLHYCKVFVNLQPLPRAAFPFDILQENLEASVVWEKMTDWLSFNTTGMHRLHRFRWELSQQKQQLNNFANNSHLIFIGPESDHWLCLSLRVKVNFLAHFGQKSDLSGLCGIGYWVWIINTL